MIAKLRVLQWRWSTAPTVDVLAPSEAQAAEYADTMGLEAFERQFTGSRRARKRVERALAKLGMRDAA